MRILLKAALKPEQIATRIRADGRCPALEAYVSSPALVTSFSEDLEDVQALLGKPAYPYEQLPDFIKAFHLPVAPAYTFDGLAFSEKARADLEAMVASLQEAGYEKIPILCHLQNPAEFWQELDLWPEMIAQWRSFSEQGVVFYIEHSQIMTQSATENRVFPCWDLAPLAYKESLEEELPILPVFDLCHMVNSARLLRELDFLSASIEEFVFDRLDRYLDSGLGHIHLAYGRSVGQGPDHHGTAFEDFEEQEFLKRFLQHLQASHYRGNIVLETNERDPMEPIRMLTLYDKICALIDF